ncbi:MAG: hypothetical protein R2716_08355 [Microthrixaceae bacterium]
MPDAIPERSGLIVAIAIAVAGETDRPTPQPRKRRPSDVSARFLLALRAGSSWRA